ncbi:MAG: LysR family transcriptional regulator substrate-binding protein, partial [Allobaculum sp.]|uniref:LysR family transcriptional regulator substrate-binding protein n=1 Tax=Allobaculum sp. TaxID=1872463 RepID=UPI00399B86CB
AQYDLHLNPDIEVAATDQILPVVRNHLGVGFVPQEFLSEEARTGDLCTLSLVETIPPRSIYLARNRDVPMSQAARALEKMILDLRE